uniref:Uncharacterized protein n=1 Tax=Micrurus lemniscatus lemniscatus TaxID=129467 RepID=A0A2D4JFH3_MICLE
MLEEWTEALWDQLKPQWSISIRKIEDWKGKLCGVTFSWGSQGRLPRALITEEGYGAMGGEQDLYNVIYEQAINVLRDAFENVHVISLKTPEACFFVAVFAFWTEIFPTTQ